MKNRVNQFKIVAVSFLLTLFALFGCGGGSGGGAASSAVQLFVTDDLHPGYSGVWVKIYKADLKTATGTTANVFSSATGLTVNLRALNDGAAKFLLLAPGQVPNDTYTKIVFEFDKSVTLIATPSGTVSTANFPNSLDASITGHSDLSLDLSPAYVVPSSPKIAIDFDLKNWTVAAGVITPVLHKSDGTGLEDPTRHEKFEFRGLVTGLAGTVPTQTFSLTLKSGGTVNVTTDDTTQIIADGSATALANNQKVEVYGAFDPTTNSIAAKIIRAESEFENDSAAIGLASNPILANHSFDLAPSCTHGFAPQGDKITVVTDANTHFRGSHGANLSESDFYAALVLAGANAVAEVEGTYDQGTNTLTAKSVHVESQTDMGDAEAKGSTGVADATAGTFDITVSESEGFTFPGGPLHVSVSTNAEYRNHQGLTMTKDEFFSAIVAASKNVEIKGSFASSLFTAARLRLKN